MREQKLYSAVLFSIERGSYPYKYRLYFAVSRKKGAEPQIHRFFVRSKKVFEQFILGGVYDIAYIGMRIKSAVFLSIYPLTNTEYFELIRLRDLHFMDDNALKEYGVKTHRYAPSEYYYTFDIFKSLVSYKPTFIIKLLINLLKLATYFLSFFIPICLYLLTVYFFSASGLTSSLTALTAFTVPIMSIMLLPFIIWMMCALYTVGNYLLLSLPFARNFLLKQYTLKWAGMRKSCYLEDDVKTKLLKSGIITFAIALISIIISFIF